jgi:hypothetical protein
MTALRDIQVAFASAVTAGDDDVLALLTDDGRQADRFEVHRNNTFASLMAVLEEAFPTVAAVLGEEFFRRMAAAYVRHDPPKANHLLDYGQGLAGFIRKSEPLADRPWLGDLADLDWAVNAAFGAADVETLTPDALAAIPPEQLMETRLPLKPGAALVRSEWPVHAIRMNPAVADGSSRLAQRSEAVLVIRPDVEVIAIPVSAAEHVFLSLLHKGNTLGEAAVAALESDPAFDIQSALARHLAGGHFAGTPNPEEQGEQP